VMRPVQRPHPPLWYGIRDPDSAVWPAAHGINIVANGPAPMVRKVTDLYRAEWASLGKPPERLPFIGMNRLMVLAEAEADARHAANRAYRTWRAHMELLWKAHGVPFPLQLPAEFETLQHHGGAFAGTSAGARTYVAQQIETAGINYFVCDVAFGHMSFEEAMRTTDLLVRDVLPAFADRSVAAR